MEVGSRVWVRDAEAAWVLGTVLSKAETSLAVEVSLHWGHGAERCRPLD
jgi:hypothetical protein